MLAFQPHGPQRTHSPSKDFGNCTRTGQACAQHGGSQPPLETAGALGVTPQLPARVSSGWGLGPSNTSHNFFDRPGPKYCHFHCHFTSHHSWQTSAKTLATMSHGEMQIELPTLGKGRTPAHTGTFSRFHKHSCLGTSSDLTTNGRKGKLNVLKIQYIGPVQ